MRILSNFRSNMNDSDFHPNSRVASFNLRLEYQQSVLPYHVLYRVLPDCTHLREWMEDIFTDYSCHNYNSIFEVVSFP